MTVTPNAMQRPNTRSRTVVFGAVCAVASLAGRPAWADSLFVEPSIAVQATGTTNANFSQDRPAAGDGIFEVDPSIVAHGDGAGYQFDANFSLDAIDYLRDTQPERILPNGTISGRLALIPETLSLGAGVTAFQTPLNPYGVNTAGVANSSSNTISTVQYRISPALDRQVTPDLLVSVHSDDTWSDVTGANTQVFGSASSGYYGLQTAMVEEQPRPIGAGVSLSDSQTRYTASQVDALQSDSGRAFLSLGFAEEWKLKAIGGYERSRFSTEDIGGTIYGGELIWKPSARTSLDATVEHRFFGTGWNAALNEQNSHFALTVSLRRDATTYLQSAFAAPDNSNVSSLANTYLSSTYTSAAERDAAVQRLLELNGLPGTLPTGAIIATEAATLLNSARASLLLFVTTRDTLAFDVFHLRSELLPGEAIGLPLLAATVDTVQNGGSLSLGHRLTPVSTVNVTLLVVDTRGLSADSGAGTIQRALRVEYNEQLSPRTTGLLGVRHQTLSSDVVPNADETAVYVGLRHRF